MKQTLLSAFALMLLSMTANANPITPARAKSIAAGYAKNGVAPVRVLRSAEANARVTGGASLEEQQQPLYIFNRGEGNGFVIVSGDDCLPEVLGYTEGGEYDEAQMPPALLEYIQHYSDMIAEVQAKGEAVTMPKNASLLDADIPAILTTDWVQGSPYNNMCPYRTDGGGRALVGCVSTATSQITYYWGKQGYCNRATQYDTPMYGYGDAPVTYSIPSGTPLRWELMCDTKGSTHQEALATLNFVTGVCAWLTYGASTGGYIWDEINVMANQYGLKGGTRADRGNYTDDQWQKLCANDLQKGHPILYSGYTSDWSGHAFVMDGYKYENEQNKFHFNYGWGSGWDGFFTIDDCRGYGTGQVMVYGIEPVDLTLETTFTVPENMLKFNNATVSVTVKNAGTNAIRGLHIVPCYDMQNPPCSLDDAIASRTSNIIRTITANLEGTFLTPNKSSVTFLLMDNRCRIVGQSEKYTLGTSVSGLVLKSLALGQKSLGTLTRTIKESGKETEIQAEKVSVLNDSIYALLENSAKTNVTSCVPRVCLDLYEYDEETQKFPVVAERDTAYVEFEAGGQNTARYGVTLKPNTLYKAVIYRRITDPACTLSDPGDINHYYFQTVAGVKGDVNSDGAVDIADVNAVLTVMFDGTEYTEQADVNGDNVVDIADVNAVLSIIFATE